MSGRARGRGGRGRGRGRGRGHGRGGRGGSRGGASKRSTGSKRARLDEDSKENIENLSIHSKLPKTALTAYTEMWKVNSSHMVAGSSYATAVAASAFAFPSTSMQPAQTNSASSSSSATTISDAMSAQTTSSSSSSSSSSSYDAMEVAKKIPGYQISMTKTTNGSPSLSSSRSFVCDLFYRGFVRFCSESELRSLLSGAWHESAELTVQCLHHSRDCRAGKGEKLVSLQALLWMREFKPMTYLLNLTDFIFHGYYKDLLNLAVEVEKRKLTPMGLNGELIELEMLADALRNDQRRLVEWQEKSLTEEQEKQERVEKTDDKMNEEKQEAKEFETEMVNAEAKGTEEINVGKQEKTEKDEMQTESTTTSVSLSPYHGPRLSLAGKWAPTADSHYDKHPHCYASRIAKLVFPSDSHRMRSYRHLCSSLRRHLNVVERLLCTNQWDQVNFSQVPSRAHALLKKAFMRHTPEKYETYLKALKKNDGTVKINTTGLQPHELVKECLHGRAGDDTVEAQWTTIVDKLKASGSLNNCISLVDVSGSMEVPNWIPMSNSIALGILTSLLAAEPFHRKVLTFSSTPTLFHVTGNNLWEMVQCVRSAPWGGSTNVDAAIELILQTGIKNHVKPEDMPKTLFIYSDMQFDSAAERPHISNYDRKTAYARFIHMYAAAGYQMPKIVFWNLNGSGTDVPVAMNAEGVALMSGFSSELLKMFLQGDITSPLAMVVRAVHMYPHQVEESEKTYTGEGKYAKK